MRQPHILLLAVWAITEMCKTLKNKWTAPIHYTRTFPHLHVDFLKTRNEVSNLAESEASHPRWSSYAHKQHPFLLGPLELLLHKVHLKHKNKRVLCELWLFVWWIVYLCYGRNSQQATHNGWAHKDITQPAGDLFHMFLCIRGEWTQQVGVHLVEELSIHNPKAKVLE